MPFSALPAPLSAALTNKGYTAPTSVQAAVIEPEAIGRDLIVSARTGSGKTIAFGLAMGVSLLADTEQLPAAGAPFALVIAPTRELALQVSRELAWLYAPLGARIRTCVGGMNPSEERRALYQGSHIVVGTPGRLRDHLERGALDLSALRFAVLDEADEMLDMGFRDDLEEILDATPAERRTFLFSATMPKPIVALAKRYQQDALRISTVEEERGHSDISYQAVAVSPADIENAVINLLRYHEAETAMLFCATRDNVRHLHAALVERGFAAVALSGEHSQNERNHAMQALRDKRARVCVATDVAARGLDVASLSLVIHVEVPRDAEILQHRSGRTGRAGKKGTAVLIVPFPRRRRVEMMLRGAKIPAEWTSVPTPEMIRAQDHERVMAGLLEPIEATDEERALAVRLLEQKTPEDLAIALVRAYASRMPAPEELIDMSARTAGGNGTPETQHHRAGFEDVVWFRMDIGRRQNADARWLLPLLCRRGHITRNEIGAIRIAQNETFFQIPTAMEAKFRAAVERTSVPDSDEEGGIIIEVAPDTPREAARENARAPRGPVRRSSPQGDGPRDHAPRDHAPRDRAPREYAPRDSAPRERAPREYAPRDSAPRDSAPRDFVKREGPPRAAPRPAPQEAPGSGEAEFRSAPRPKLHASAPRDGAPKGKGPGTKGAFGKGKAPFGKGPGGPRGAGKPFRKGPRP